MVARSIIIAVIFFMLAFGGFYRYSAGIIHRFGVLLELAFAVLCKLTRILTEVSGLYG